MKGSAPTHGYHTYARGLDSNHSASMGYNKHVEFARFAPGYHDAVKRAHALDRMADEDEEPGRNPTTGVWRLTESIRVDHHAPPEKS